MPKPNRNATAVLFLTLTGVFQAQSFGAQVYRATLEASDQEIVLGQPLVLKVCFHNNSGTAVTYKEIIIAGQEPDIEVLFSKNGVDFQKYVIGLYGWISYLRHPQRTIPAGEAQTYEIKMLYSQPGHKRWGGLVLVEPGEYFFKARFPLRLTGAAQSEWHDPQLAGPTETQWYESNVIRVMVTKPEGADALVWKRLQPRHFCFLQTDNIPALVIDKKVQRFPEVPMELARILKDHPKSAYSQHILASLKAYYKERRQKFHRDQALEDEELTLIREVTGIEEPPVPMLFPEDPRLDVQITYSYPELTPWSQIFQDMSSQSGVPLTVDPKLQRSAITGDLKMTLREWMDRKDTWKATWIIDGQGYRLVPNDGAAVAE